MAGVHGGKGVAGGKKKLLFLSRLKIQRFPEPASGGFLIGTCFKSQHTGGPGPFFLALLSERDFFAWLVCGATVGVVADVASAIFYVEFVEF